MHACLSLQERQPLEVCLCTYHTEPHGHIPVPAHSPSAHSVQCPRHHRHGMTCRGKCRKNHTQTPQQPDKPESTLQPCRCIRLHMCAWNLYRNCPRLCIIIMCQYLHVHAQYMYRRRHQKYNIEHPKGDEGTHVRASRRLGEIHATFV